MEYHVARCPTDTVSLDTVGGLPGMSLGYSAPGAVPGEVPEVLTCGTVPGKVPCEVSTLYTIPRAV